MSIEEIMEKVDGVEKRAIEAIENITDVADVPAVQDKFLGEKGELVAAVEGSNDLAKEEQEKIAQRIELLMSETEDALVKKLRSFGDQHNALTFDELIEHMFDHFEKRDNLKADLIEAITTGGEPEKQKASLVAILAHDRLLAANLATVNGIGVVDLFIAMTMVEEAHHLVARVGDPNSAKMAFATCDRIEVTIRGELEHRTGKKLHNTRLELLVNAAEGQAQQRKIILASK